MNLANSILLSGKVLALESAMREMPQVEFVTSHFFCDDGMYARALEQDAGSLVVGKQHKRAHFLIVLKGRVSIAMGDEVKEYNAGSVIISKPGAKRAILALEDSVYLTVHRTNKKNLRKIEKELIVDDQQAMFDSFNKLKALP